MDTSSNVAALGSSDSCRHLISQTVMSPASEVPSSSDSIYISERFLAVKLAYALLVVYWMSRFNFLNFFLIFDCRKNALDKSI